MEQESKNYEIAYILAPSLAEEEILTCAGKISALIEEQKGNIKHLQEPKRHKLAYLVNKERNAYFGWTTFQLSPQSVAALEKKLKLETSIMRYLIIEEETRLKAPVFRTPIAKPGTAKTTAVPRETEKSEEKLDLEALDKKLEEILGK